MSRSGESSYTGARISYHRRKEIDYFHPAPSGKVRVTRDAETLAIKPDGIIQKTRIADLNIHCPNRLFDYRISINVERPAEEPTSDHVSIREKNRLSYAHQNFIVDLTQVTVPEKVSIRTPGAYATLRETKADSLCWSTRDCSRKSPSTNSKSSSKTWSSSCKLVHKPSRIPTATVPAQMVRNGRRSTIKCSSSSTTSDCSSGKLLLPGPD